jgi:hypothetical protein
MREKFFIVIVFVSALSVFSLAFVHGCTYGNSAPVINGLYSEHDGLFGGQNCEIVAVASDPDGDKLSYQWLVSKGDVSGDGSRITWTAPDTPGFYSISVIVADEGGAESSMTLTLNVAANALPVIIGLEAEEPGCRTNASVMVECTACDPECDILAYRWQATGGEIEGEGASVRWNSPGEAGTYTITVSVTDGMGGVAEHSLDIEVEEGG